MRNTVFFGLKTGHFLITILLLFSGCRNSTELSLSFGDPLSETAHIFTETYDGDVLVQIHLYSVFVAAMKEIGGPDEMEVIRGNDKEHYFIRPVDLLYENKIVIGVKFGVFHEEYGGKQIGTVTVYTYTDSHEPSSLLLNLKGHSDLQFDNLVDMHRYEVVNAIDRYEIEPKSEIELIACLSDAYTFNGSWSLADKTLIHFLHIAEDPTIEDYTPLQEDWQMDVSPDGIIRTFRSWYYQGGNGWGSSWQKDFIYYRSGEINHIIQGFYDWAYGDEMVHGNFPYMDETNIKTWGRGDDKIYLFEATFFDPLPIPFGDEKEPCKEFFTTLGAFRIVDGSLTPVSFMKTKKQTFDKVCVIAANENPRFYVNEGKGILGVPLVETGDYAFRGKYLVYEWNPKSGMFEYTGKKEKL